MIIKLREPRDPVRNRPGGRGRDSPDGRSASVESKPGKRQKPGPLSTPGGNSEFPLWTPEWLTVYPRASSLESQSSKRKKILGACLFEMAHLGGRSPQKPTAAGAAAFSRHGSSFLTDCLLLELLPAAGIGAFLEPTATWCPYTLIISVSYLGVGGCPNEFSER
jgi:hypothetical protein